MFFKLFNDFLLSIKGNYPLVNKQIWRADVAKNFEKIPFIICRHLNQSGALYDDTIDPFLNWMCTLSGYEFLFQFVIFFPLFNYFYNIFNFYSSSIRPFRHTITEFGLNFTTALLELLSNLQTEYEQNQKLLLAEEKGKKV